MLERIHICIYFAECFSKSFDYVTTFDTCHFEYLNRTVSDRQQEETLLCSLPFQEACSLIGDDGNDKERMKKEDNEEEGKEV